MLNWAALSLHKWEFSGGSVQISWGSEPGEHTRGFLDSQSLFLFCFKNWIYRERKQNYRERVMLSWVTSLVLGQDPSEAELEERSWVQVLAWEVIPGGTRGKWDGKQRKSMQGEVMSSVPLWAPGAQVPVGSLGKMHATHTLKFSHWRDEGWYSSLTAVRHGGLWGPFAAGGSPWWGVGVGVGERSWALPW